MKNQNREAFLANAAPWLLLIMAAIICLWRVRYFYEPLENDIGIRMAYATRSLLGDQYYTDVFVFGPPGSLWINEIFVSIFGANFLSVYVMGCIFSVITLMGVYRIAFILSGNTAALISAVTWTVINADLYTQANQPNTEVFINAAMVWAFALLLGEKSQKNIGYAVSSGLLFFLASTIKHFTIVVPVMAFFALALSSRTDTGKWKPFLYNHGTWFPWIIAGSVATVSWALLLTWYWFTGRFTLLIDALLGNSIQYATAQSNSGLASNFITGLELSRLLPWFHVPFLFLYLSLIASVAIKIFKMKEARWFIVAGWFIGTWLSVCFPGKFFPHYYMLWLPLIAIGPGILFDLMDKSTTTKFKQTIKFMIVLMILALAIRQIHKFVTIDPVEAAGVKYGELGYVFAETRDLGQKIALQGNKNTSIFEIGVHGLYFFANATPPSRFVDSLYSTVQPDKYINNMRKYINVNPPELLVVRRSLLTEKANGVLNLFANEVLRSGLFVEVKELSSKRLIVFRHIGDTRTRERVPSSPAP